MRYIVIGTAGHIDHGKTTLVKALTGVNTDRLIEEQKRGVSIELGFAEFKLPDGQNVSIVDVPGHERFIKNMLAGATGIDLMLLVVAADDGVMPQTIEHLTISVLLGVKRGVVALTKADLVDEEWLGVVKEDIRELLKGTSFKNAPIVSVSSVTGYGLDELIKEISQITKETLERDTEAPFRLPIDRVFTLKGIGTVVTGTLFSGIISVGKQVEILPGGIQARVRSLQVHNQSVEKAFAGQRVAVNLVGVSFDELERGEVVISPGHFKSSILLHAKLHYLLDVTKPLKNRTRVRFHHGTQEVLGRVVLLEREELFPGQTGFVQMVLESPIVPRYGDRFIIRSYSPAHTIGGGEVLDAHPLKRRRCDVRLIERLRVLAERNPVKVVFEAFTEKEIFPLSEEDLLTRTEISLSETKGAVNQLLNEGKICELKGSGKLKLYVLKRSYEEIKKLVTSYLEDFHKTNPLKPGEKREIVRNRFLSRLPVKLADEVINDLVLSKVIVQEEDILKQPGVKSGLRKEHQEVADKISQLLKSSWFSPPTLNEIEENLKINQNELRMYLKELALKGDVARVKHDLYFYREALKEIEAKLVEFLKSNGKINPSQFKELFEISRKYALPLLEYFDAKRVTRRVGNDRVLWG